MYGVVAGQKRGNNRTKQLRDQNAEEKDSEKCGLTEKLMQYLKRRFNPPAGEFIPSFDVQAVQLVIKQPFK
ncbi:unnamed protein product [Arctia plantaginis]|uniref:Uncharacterized protein n=1 Tax=Arctia plantaginis TaxID=874455 RepID=A0A8S1AY24_ARCPL|nr:unnamed protein product [Arctia plantaginis]